MTNSNSNALNFIGYSRTIIIEYQLSTDIYIQKKRHMQGTQKEDSGNVGNKKKRVNLNEHKK